MAQRTTTTTTTDNAGHAARKASRKAGAVHRIAKQAAAADAALDDASEADDAGEATTARRGQWAAEKARAAAQGNCGTAAFRWAKLADVLIGATVQGERKLAFAEVNKRADLNRGERGEPVASWRLALQRTRQVGHAIDGWQVDADAGALVYRGE